MVLKNKNKLLIKLIVLLYLVLLFSSNSSAQDDKAVWLNQSQYSFKVNSYWDVILPNRPFPSILSGNYPNGSDKLATIGRSKAGFLIGHIKTENGQEYGPFGNENKPLYSVGKYGGMKTGYTSSLPFGVWEITKHPIPNVFVNGENANVYDSSPGVIWEIDPNQKADKMARVYKKHDLGLYIDTKAYQMVNHYYGDFVIMEKTFKLTFDESADSDNTPDPGWDTSQTVEDFYFIQGYSMPAGNQAGPVVIDTEWYVTRGGYWMSHMKAPSIVSGSNRNELVIGYGRDWDFEDAQVYPVANPFGRIFDDYGDPRMYPVADGNLLTTAWKGWSLLHCDSSPTDKNDWVNTQPHSYRVFDIKHTEGGETFPANTGWEAFAAVEPGTYDVSSYEDGTDLDSRTGNGASGKCGCMCIGGWDLVMGDSVTIVWVIGAGSISREEARNVGKAWSNWYQYGDVPEAYYKGELATDELKNRIVDQGRDSLITTMQRAQELWLNNLECPHPYPSPDLFVSSDDRACKLLFSDVAEQYENPNGGASDVVAYKIYRKQGNVLDEYGPEAGLGLYWTMIEELTVDQLTKEDGKYVYYDNHVIIGEDYHYAVTAVSDRKCGIDGTGPRLESSKYLNRTQIAAQGQLIGKSSLDEVVVVPNPFYSSGGVMNILSDPNRLMVFNLPSKCNVKIYNITGDLILDKEHTDGTSLELWDQITNSNQYIASGIYILVVSDAKKETTDVHGNIVHEEIPGKKIVKFSIVR